MEIIFLEKFTFGSQYEKSTNIPRLKNNLKKNSTVRKTIRKALILEAKIVFEKSTSGSMLEKLSSKILPLVLVDEK